ncbi:MAG: DUF11 domain-containing protein [Oscillospiraceae bacterium]|nr:DUF11 domain-containing protein [Oscillospiraceae bacterium]
MRKLRKIVVVMLLIAFGIMSLADINVALATSTRVLDVRSIETYDRPSRGAAEDTAEYTLQEQPPRYHINRIFDVANSHREANQREISATTNQYPDAIYSLRAGIGFDVSDMEEGTAREYRRYGDMFTDELQVRNRFNQVINAQGNPAAYRGTITEESYNAILWLIEQMYLPRFAVQTNHPNHANRDIGREEMRLQLLTNVREGIERNPLVTVAHLNAWLSDDDIEIVQQIVLWEFTNPDRGNNTSEVLGDELEEEDTLFARILSESNPNTAFAMSMLYDYLMEGATEVENGMIPFSLSSSEAVPEITLGDTLPTMRSVMLGTQPQWVVGPFSIEGTNLDAGVIELANQFGTLRATTNGSWTDDLNIPIGTAPGNARIVNAGLVQISSDLESMINEGQFFLMIPIIPGMARDNIIQFDLEINYSYSFFTVRSACYYDVDLPLTLPQEQPVVIVDKLRHVGAGRDSLSTPGAEGSFDLQIGKLDEAGQLITSDSATFEVIRIMPGEAPNILMGTHHTINGVISLNDIEITSENEEFIFRITETRAPEGYEIMVAPFYVRVRAERIRNEYRARDIASGLYETGLWINDVIGVTVEVEAGVAQVGVRNLRIPTPEGSFDLQVGKLNQAGELITRDSATFEIIRIMPGETPNISVGTYDTAYGILSLNNIQIISENEEFIFRIRETRAPEGHEIMVEPFYVRIETERHDNALRIRNISSGIYASGPWTNNVTGVTVGIEADTVQVGVRNRQLEYDLALRKFITMIRNDIDVIPYDRAPIPGVNIDVSGLMDGTSRTAIYDHPSNLLIARTGDIVTYTIRIFNEGELPGIATEITNWLPEGLELYTGSVINQTYGWIQGQRCMVSGEIPVTTRYLENLEQIPAFNRETGELQFVDVRIEAIVVATPQATPLLLRNVAEITENDSLEGASSRYQQDGDYADLVLLPAEQPEDAFNLQIRKLNEVGQLITSGSATFEIERIMSGEASNISIGAHDTLNGIVHLNNIEITEENEEFIFRITETRAPEWHEIMVEPFYVRVRTESYGDTFRVRDIYSGVGAEGPWANNVSGVNVSRDENVVQVGVRNRQLEYDLALRKFITMIRNDAEVRPYDRAPIPGVNIDVTGLMDGTATTAIYNHPKNSLPVRTGDIVTYTIRIFNEGDIAATATEITNWLPEGLELYSGSAINQTYGWVQGQTCSITNRTAITTSHLESLEQIPEFNRETGELQFIDVRIEVVVVVAPGAQAILLRNIAEVTEDDSPEGIFDRDSKPDDVMLVNYNPPRWPVGENSRYQQDDDDYEDLLLLPDEEREPEFDLAIRKFVAQINDRRLTGINSREPSIYLYPLRDRTETTARYVHSKDPVAVRQGDIVIFTIRVYNEGDMDGFASEITNHLPEGLGFIIDHRVNFENGWRLPTTLPESATIRSLVGTGENDIYRSIYEIRSLGLSDFIGVSSLEDVQIVEGRLPVTTSTLQRDEHNSSRNLIRAYNPDLRKSDVLQNENWQVTSEANFSDGLFYREVQIAAIVLTDNAYTGTLRSIAEITENQDKNGNTDINDRDSRPGNVNTENYRPPADNSEYQEDDDDYEQLVLQYFDLSLRKFIRAVETGPGDNRRAIAPNPSREPIVTMPPGFLSGERTTLTYTHPKREEPVGVANGDIVLYTIRIFNEGTMAGFAAEIRNELPEGIEFLPEHPINLRYEWNLYAVERDEDGTIRDQIRTTDVGEATEVRTSFLSYERNGEIIQGTEIARNNLMGPFDPTQPIRQPTSIYPNNQAPWNAEFRDVQIVFRVVERDLPEDSERIIRNVAEITENQDEYGRKIADIDSRPDNDIYEEDDQDSEYIFVRYFDLGLSKWVDRVLITTDGNTVTRNYNMPVDELESEFVVGINMNGDHIRHGNVDVVYTIRVFNSGQVAGYATEITNYLPPGMTFVQSDNPLWETTGDNRVITRALERTRLEPGEYVDIEIRMRWINDEENLGLRRNLARISEWANDYNAPDINSDNEEAEAWVTFERQAGEIVVHITIAGGVLAMLAGGLVLIKRFVLS